MTVKGFVKQCATHIVENGFTLCLLREDACGDYGLCPVALSGNPEHCKYFKQAVLPEDKELEAAYKTSRQVQGAYEKDCKTCHKTFHTTARNKEYCPTCAAKRLRMSHRNAQRKLRASKA